MNSPPRVPRVVSVAALAFALLASLVLVTPTRAFADDDPASRAPLGEWQETLESADAMVQAGEYKKARKTVDRLVDDMVENIVSGETDRLFAMASLLRALAEAGLGHEFEALWHFHVARHLDESINGLDLAAYGDAGAFLSAPRTSAWEGAHGTSWSDSEVQPPEKTKWPGPDYPLGKKFACQQGLVILKAVVDRDGLPREPRVLKADDRVLGFLALRTLGRWRFEPARLDGEPVAYAYTLTMNFRLPKCDS